MDGLQILQRALENGRWSGATKKPPELKWASKLCNLDQPGDWRYSQTLKDPFEHLGAKVEGSEHVKHSEIRP